MMRKLILAATLAAVVAPVAPVLADPPHRDWRDKKWSKKHRDDRYYADDHYRRGNYRERRLAANEPVYRGRDGRYYCKRKDGTTGLIIGGVAGGLLGNTIAPGGSKTLGAILGGAGGALLGKSLDDGVKCR